MLKEKRLDFTPNIPQKLKNIHAALFKPTSKKGKVDPEILPLFPKTAHTPFYSLEIGSAPKIPLHVGVVFSGGPASGGHNVIAALFDTLQRIHKESKLFGFMGGPSGILENQGHFLEKKEVDSVRNLGGFYLLGTGRTKIEKEQDFDKVIASLKKRGLRGLVVIGGDDSNTNGALLAEYVAKRGENLFIIGVPKTIDGDLRSEEIEESFGFDTATKAYGEIIGNLASDAMSAGKYYHFIKLMGRSASHIALECAHLVHPNLTLIGEERKKLSTLVDEIATLVQKRSAAKKEYGVILIPEGLLEFIPEMERLFEELKKNPTKENLSKEALLTLELFPEKIQHELVCVRDPHGNIRVSQIETETFLIELVKKELKKRGFEGSFSPQNHFLGYEGRSGFPTPFDTDYSYVLGIIAALAIRDQLTGVIVAAQNVHQNMDAWTMSASPIVQMFHLEKRDGKSKPVIAKALVDLSGEKYKEFARKKEEWKMDDDYQFPGPIQF